MPIEIKFLIHKDNASKKSEFLDCFLIKTNNQKKFIRYTPCKTSLCCSCYALFATFLLLLELLANFLSSPVYPTRHVYFPPVCGVRANSGNVNLRLMLRETLRRGKTPNRNLSISPSCARDCSNNNEAEIRPLNYPVRNENGTVMREQEKI